MPSPRLIVLLSVLGLVGLVSFGCATARTTDTARTGIEQLLISNAVDRALDKFDFSMLRGHSVFIDDKYIDCVDKGYLLASIRERVLCHGASIAPKIDAAEVALEIRSGGMGTDNAEVFVGTPKLSVPGLMPLELPEVKLWNRTSHLGTAKIGILAYDAKTGVIIQQGGHALARSDDTKWYLLGVGPFQQGSVKTEVEQRTAEPFAMARYTPHSQRPAFVVSQPPSPDDQPLPPGQPAQPAAYYAQPPQTPAQYR